MIIQLHHQFKDRTHFMIQRDISDNEEMQAFVMYAKERFPLPVGAVWVACNQESEFFTMEVVG